MNPINNPSTSPQQARSFPGTVDNRSSKLHISPAGSEASDASSASSETRRDRGAGLASVFAEAQRSFPSISRSASEETKTVSGETKGDNPIPEGTLERPVSYSLVDTFGNKNFIINDNGFDTPKLLREGGEDRLHTRQPYGLDSRGECAGLSTLYVATREMTLASAKEGVPVELSFTGSPGVYNSQCLQAQDQAMEIANTYIDRTSYFARMTDEADPGIYDTFPVAGGADSAGFDDASAKFDKFVILTALAQFDLSADVHKSSDNPEAVTDTILNSDKNHFVIMQSVLDDDGNEVRDGHMIAVSKEDDGCVFVLDANHGLKEFAGLDRDSIAAAISPEDVDHDKHSIRITVGEVRSDGFAQQSAAVMQNWYDQFKQTDKDPVSDTESDRGQDSDSD